MSFQPKGIVWFPDVIRAVGEYKYGKDAWIGSDVSSLNNEWLRAKAAKDPLAASTGERVKAAVTQWRAVAELMRQEFIGTAPKHKDAVPVYLFGFDRNGPLPWTIWRDDQDADAMLISGKVHADGRPSYHPGKHGWSPTAALIPGPLYLAEADLPRLLQAAAPTVEAGAPQDTPDPKSLYRARVAEHGGALPPLRTTKGGIMGDYGWAETVGIRRSEIDSLRGQLKDEGYLVKKGRPKS